MNTTSHVIMNLLPQRYLLRNTVQKKWVISGGIFGSLLPDIPMFLFFIYASIIQGQEQSEIWFTSYYLPGWQEFFNIFNSIPLFLIVLLIAYWKHLPGLSSLSLGGLLHSMADFLVRHDDGHAHLWPFSDWRFNSPVSYWDPGAYGKVFAPVELIAILFITTKLWPNMGMVGRILLVLANLFNLFATMGTFFFFGGDIAGS